MSGSSGRPAAAASHGRPAMRLCHRVAAARRSLPPPLCVPAARPPLLFSPPCAGPSTPATAVAAPRPYATAGGAGARSVLTPEALELMSYRDLQQIAKAYGCKATGKRAILEQRVLEMAAAPAGENDRDADPAAGGWNQGEGLGLSSELRERSVRVEEEMAAAVPSGRGRAAETYRAVARASGRSEFWAVEQVSWGDAAVARRYEDGFGSLTCQSVGPLLDRTAVGAGCRVLDVATGPGVVVLEAVDRGALCCGVDFSQEVSNI
jgi:hypothetical protein